MQTRPTAALTPLPPACIPRMIWPMLGVLFMPHAEAADDLAVPRLEQAQRIVAVRGGGYFPVLIELNDGSLGAVVRGGAPHIGIGGRLDWISSKDGGRTWAQPQVIVDSKWDDRNPAVGQMKDGTLVVAYAEAQTYNEKGEWDRSAGEYKLFYVLSTDNGATWGPKRELYGGPIRSGSPFGRIALLEDGTALMALYGKADPAWVGPPALPEEADALSGIVRSRDNGRTWGDFSLVTATGHNELQPLPLGRGRLLAMLRTYGDAHIARCFSDDAGYSWSAPLPVTEGAQHPPDVCRLRSGRLLLTYGNRRQPLGVGAVISTDGGGTWLYDQRAMLAWTCLNADCGYPSTVQLRDDTIVTLYYAVGASDHGPGAMAVAVRYTEQQLLQAMGLR